MYFVSLLLVHQSFSSKFSKKIIKLQLYGLPTDVFPSQPLQDETKEERKPTRSKVIEFGINFSKNNKECKRPAGLHFGSNTN